MILFCILILLLYIICKFNKNNYEHFNNNSRISVGIPCILRDIKKIERLLKSIENQTYKPYEVLIGLSGVTKKISDDYEKLFNNKYNLNIKLISTNKECYAGGNRNRIIENVKSDIISFIDADDTMHPQKLQKIYQLFKEYKNLKVLVHTYSPNYNKFSKLQIFPRICNLEDINKAINDDTTIYPERLRNNLPEKYLGINQITHGHITCKTSLLKKIKYNETKKYMRGQDSLLIRNLINYFNIIYKKRLKKNKIGKKELEKKFKNQFLIVNLPLSQYIPSYNQ